MNQNIVLTTVIASRTLCATQKLNRFAAPQTASSRFAAREDAGEAHLKVSPTCGSAPAGWITRNDV